jgi:hypothetical protein
MTNQDDRHRVYMSFMDRNGWHCQFLEKDLQQTTSRTVKWTGRTSATAHAGVVGQVVEDMLRPAERRLGVDHPVLAAEFLQELDECVRRGKLLKRAMELEPVLLEEFTKPGAELTAEAPAKRLNGRKKRDEESIHLEPSRARPPARTM